MSTSLEEKVETNSVSSLTMEKVPITQSHISVQYVLINALSSTLLEDVDCVFWVPMQCYPMDVFTPEWVLL